MPALAMCAFIAAYTVGWDPVRSWILEGGDVRIAIQAALHAGLFLGLAGAAISACTRCRSALPLLVIGSMAVMGLLTEDITGITNRHAGSAKDLIDLGQRLGLLALFSLRFQSVKRVVFA